MNNVDVLNLEWTSYPSRDRQAATLVSNYLRCQGLNVVEESIHNGFEVINRCKPNVLFMTNSVGASINYQVMKYARKREIKSLSLASEGNIKGWSDDVVKQFFWGWNKENVLYENINLQWSKRAKDLITNIYPNYSDRIGVSGGAGFDQYIISSSNNREETLSKYKKNRFNKVIGVGCYDFGPLFPEDSRHELEMANYSADQAIRFKADRDNFNEVLLQIISNNPDKLFILKVHPGNQLGHSSAGIEGAHEYKNVLILKTEENIYNCIAASDFWLTYESTTALEAWLMKKSTLLLNPSGVDFKRDNLFKGSPFVTGSTDLQNSIDSFYTQGSLLGFEELEGERRTLITDTIGWDDGLNHVRAGNRIIELLHEENTSIKNETISQYFQRVLHSLYWNYGYKLSMLPHFRYYAKKRKLYSQNNLDEYGQHMLSQQKEFYKKIDLTALDLEQIL